MQLLSFSCYFKPIEWLLAKDRPFLLCSTYMWRNEWSNLLCNLQFTMRNDWFNLSRDKLRPTQQRMHTHAKQVNQIGHRAKPKNGLSWFFWHHRKANKHSLIQSLLIRDNDVYCMKYLYGKSCDTCERLLNFLIHIKDIK